MSTQLNTEEREIVETFERGELRRVAEVEAEMEAARQAARDTVKQTRRVTERASTSPAPERDEEGIPHQRLLTSVIHKYLSCRLRDRSWEAGNMNQRDGVGAFLAGPRGVGSLGGTSRGHGTE